MSNFNCEQCGAAIQNNEILCEHYLKENIMVNIPRKFAEQIYKEFWNIS